nr:GNAT family N-acetyltransferase [Corynebacterium lactis]
MLAVDNARDQVKWEADVVLNDGGIATLRPVTAFDRTELRNFYARVSERSKYLRFFGTHPELTDEDLRDWLGADGRDRVTLVVVERSRIVGVATYRLVEQFLPERIADVAFLVQDSHHGRGVGNILLEHLAEVGRERGIARFTAEMLPKNRQMVQTFLRAGYSVAPELADGFIAVDFSIAASPVSREVMERRELRAEANSLRRLLNPRSIVVVDFGDAAGGTDQVVRSLWDSGYGGDLHVVHVDSHGNAGDGHDGGDGHRMAAALDHLGRSGSEGGSDPSVDLVIIPQTPNLFEGLDEVMGAAARRGAYGVIVLASNESPAMSSESAKRLVEVARDWGLRALGPAALGVINTGGVGPDGQDVQDGTVRLNVTPAPMPRSGPVGVFAQSAGVASVMAAQVLRHGTGISSFVGAGLFADVTGNDVMQYWSDDERTHVCLLSLDTVGNPRKFFRVLRRLALVKHVIVFLPSRALQQARHYDNAELVQIGADGIDEVIRGTGAMVVSRRETMFNVAQILERQPVPPGNRVAVISNSSGLLRQMEQSARRFGLVPTAIGLQPDSDGTVAAIDRAVADVLGDEGVPARGRARVDAVVVAVVEAGEPLLADAADVLTRHATAGAGVPVVASLVGFGDVPSAQHAGDLPIIDNYADALEALGLIVQTQRRRELARPSPSDELPAIGEDARKRAFAAVDEILGSAPEGRWATDAEATDILAAYGITVEPWRPVCDEEEAIAAAEELGWDVVLKSTNRVFKGRPELPSVIRHISSPQEMRLAWKKLMAMAREVGLDPDGDIGAVQPVVQATVPSGTTLTLSAVEDATLGPVTSAGIAGLASEVLGDVSYATSPLRRSDAHRMLTGLRSAALLTGGLGLPAADLAGVEEVLMRLSALADDIPAIVEVELYPVVVAEHSSAVVGARLRVAPLSATRDPSARSLA